MGNNDNNDLDDELVRSIEKLVEEETNVAKAFVDNSSNADKSDKVYSIDRNNISGNTAAGESTTRIYTDDDMDLGATRMIDKDAIEEDVKFKKTVSPVAPVHSNTGRVPARDIRTATEHHADKARLDNRVKADVSDNKKTDNKNMVIIAASVVSAAVIIIIIAAVVINLNNKKSFTYNYEKGMEYYNDGNVSEAKNYLSAAYNTSEGKRSVSMMSSLADIYIADKDYDNAVDVLKAILEYDVQNTDALGKLADIYYQKSDGTELTNLIKKYDGSKASSALDGYRVSEPSPSEVPGTLNEPVELTLIAQDGCSIYYTTDGSEPTVKSTQYMSPIKIEKDSVTIKAVAVNKMGVISKTVTLQYTVSLQAPEAAELTIDSSTVPEGTVIMIKNLEEGCKAYYTVDGTTPTANSIIYNDGIDLKPGSYVLSVVVINKSNLSSPITRKNITIEAGKNYTYAEAQGILVARMKELNILNANGRFSVGGQTPEFVFQSKKTIDNIDMYYIRLDIKETSSTEGYYGVGVNNGKCYRITGSGSNAKAVEY